MSSTMGEAAPSPFQPHGWQIPEDFGVKNDRPFRGNETILFVDDEPMIGSLGKMTLSQFGYRVFVAESGSKALEIARSRPIDLMVLDLMMPDWSGLDTLREFRRESISIGVLLSSGWTSENLDAEQLDEVLGFLKKPYRPNQLLLTVRACIDECIRRCG